MEASVAAVGERHRATHRVPHDVAAGAKSRDQGRVQGGDERPQPRLDHPVELEALAGGEPHRPVGHLVGEAVHCQPLVGGKHSSRDARPGHEDMSQLHLAPGSVAALVAVVLGVDAVELDQVLAVGRQGRRPVIGEVAREGPSEAPAALLHRFDAHLRHDSRKMTNAINFIVISFGGSADPVRSTRHPLSAPPHTAPSP